MATSRTAWFRRILAGLLVAIIAVPLWREGVVTAQTSPRSIDEELARAIANGGQSPDRVVVVYDQGAGVADSRRQRARQQVTAQAVESIEGAINRDIVWVSNSQAAQAAATLRRQPGVRDAYPDAVASINKTVNDPYIDDQWALAKMQVPLAWDSSAGNNVKVAVLDCGIHRAHPDLVGRVVLEHNFSGTATVDDRCDHGTHVAGIIGARTNNGLGVAGVVPEVELLNGKVLADTGSGFFSSIDAGIRWAADQGARVINLSLSGSLPCLTGTQAAVNYAWSKGAVVVAAAGNTGQSSASTPANCQNVVAVAATDSNDARASFSNYGTGVDVAAPGVGIYSTVNPDLHGGSAYAYFSGTSMASPNAAGVVALIWSSSFGTGAQAVVDRLYATADPIAGTGSAWAAGRVNAARAVAPAASAVVGGRDFGITPRSNDFRLSWTAGTAQLGYLLDRFVPDGAVWTPSATDTAYIDSSAGTAFSCYILLPYRSTGALGQSDALCGQRGWQSATRAPGDFTLRLHESETVDLSWTHPGGQSLYQLLALPLNGGASRTIPLPGNSTATTDVIGNVPTCYLLYADFSSGSDGNTNLVCGLPGVATLESATEAISGTAATATPPTQRTTDAATADAKRKVAPLTKRVDDAKKVLDRRLRDRMEQVEQEITRPRAKDRPARP